MDELVIGILGGMGTYATIHIFQQYAEIFEAEKEWDRPRIVIDNRCTMPSRVKAFLMNENVEKLEMEMLESLNGLVDMGCSRIIVGCNTAHIFIEELVAKNNDLACKIVNIIDVCVEKVISMNLKEVYLIASEGTIESQVYQEKLRRRGVVCDTPSDEDYYKIRMCIEAVKQNTYNNETEEMFLDLINRGKNCILGCTELPILYKKYIGDVKGDYMFDPIELTLKEIRKAWKK